MPTRSLLARRRCGRGRASVEAHRDRAPANRTQNATALAGRGVQSEFTVRTRLKRERKIQMTVTNNTASVEHKGPHYLTDADREWLMPSSIVASD